MKNGTPASLQAPVAHRHYGFEVGQRVELKRGKLTGMGGVLIGFRGERGCLIDLDDFPRGVLLIVDAAAVKTRPVRAAEL